MNVNHECFQLSLIFVSNDSLSFFQNYTDFAVLVSPGNKWGVFNINILAALLDLAYILVECLDLVSQCNFGVLTSEYTPTIACPLFLGYSEVDLPVYFSGPAWNSKVMYMHLVIFASHKSFVDYS